MLARIAQTGFFGVRVRADSVLKATIAAQPLSVIDYSSLI